MRLVTRVKARTLMGSRYMKVLLVKGIRTRIMAMSQRSSNLGLTNDEKSSAKCVLFLNAHEGPFGPEILLFSAPFSVFK